ncbi:hypothetical protein BDW22DRAFT_1410049 [Trametopsis cervina]|nr:hypothetical protein BDW22DRAFT_1410049 [Trametopsis cervina]
MADFVTKAIDNASHGLTVQAAMEKLGLHERHCSKKDVIPGLEVRLLPHQLIGVSWMVDQELHSPHKGGILADDMGLGKTVQMIATMVMNLPKDEDQSRTTLIVVPGALLLQWKEELEQKTNAVFSVHIHHGKDKLPTPDQLQTKDVIITTYQTLVNEFNAPPSIDPDDIYEWAIEHGGPVARMRWFRVILDEAQFIRNRVTRASKAVAMLRTKYRWCLTGTPVTNTLADIYGLLRFGHFRPWNDWQSFNSYIVKTQMGDALLAGSRAQAILQPLTLRRTKHSELEGRPILELPNKHVELVELEFSPDERQLYEHIQRRAQLQINRFINNGTVAKNHGHVLVLILRLRQLCCHPNLILSLSGETTDPALVVSSKAEQEFARAVSFMGTKWAFEYCPRFLERAKLDLLDLDEEDFEAPEGECFVCDDPYIEDNGRVLACGHDICDDCRSEIAAAPIAHDGIFGEADEMTNMQKEKEFETAVAKGLRPCPTCKKMNDMRPTAVFRVSAFQPSREELRNATRRQYRRVPKDRAKPSPQPATLVKKIPSSFDIGELSDSSDEDLPDTASILKSMKLSSTSNTPRKVKQASADDVHISLRLTPPESTDITLGDIMGDKPPARRQPPQGSKGSQETVPDETPSDALVRTWKQGGANVEPSTKMLALVGFVQEWESTGDKIICFSQWTSMLDLVEMMFARYGTQSLRYDGSMDRAAREAVLARFRQPGGPRVILISMKCGGVGLNLTSANRIVNLDLSWNYATESQAYDRVHRLGQEKEVFVKRLVVKNTLEERMLRLQDTKTGLAEAALGEGTGVKLHKLSVKELKDLFGMSKDKEPTNQSRLSFGKPA